MQKLIYYISIIGFLSIWTQTGQVDASLTMKRLYEELFTDYNRLIIPIAPNRTRVTVKLGLKLGQILDINLKQQILSTNVWVEQYWHDYRLEWDPASFGGIDMIHVPAENIWIPDIVLFNNADGNYELTLVAKAVLYANGSVVWKPPTMFRSTCEIDVEFFPFDIQACFLRFGSWTYAGDEIEIRHVGQKKTRKIDIGIDLSQFYKNVEWDIIEVPAYYNENYYECCQEPYPDITFKIVIRRKMLFYLVNLILPVALMTFMTVSVFYLPADSNEKVTLSISILTSLIVFFLLMLEVIPPTSLAVPLFGKYLLFTLVLVSLSACVSVYVLNIYHRAPSVHQMSPRMRKLFLKTLPRLLRLNRPDSRERSSLNRFRKKKIAQQILQARQHNKVYDLAQPLAASLNLIGTLHKSYQIDPKDDSMKGSKRTVDEFGFMSEDGEEGRYFRKYVDDYIEQLEANEAKNLNQQRSALLEETNNVRSQSGSAHSSSMRKTTKSSGLGCKICHSGGNNSFMVSGQQVCCEHQRCCQSARRPMDWTKTSGHEHPQFRQTYAAAVAAASGVANNSSCKNCVSNTRTTAMDQQQHFGMVNDDTLDMTFDYDDHDDSQPPAPPPASFHQTMLGGARHQDSKQLNLDELPSPPPPPRQLAQLSDSMRDLTSGRVSSCSQQQQRLLTKANARQASNADCGLDDDDDDDDDDDGDYDYDYGDEDCLAGRRGNDGHRNQLVDKLVSSIQLLNTTTEAELDAQTTTSSNSVEGLIRNNLIGSSNIQQANRLHYSQPRPTNEQIYKHNNNSTLIAFNQNSFSEVNNNNSQTRRCNCNNNNNNNNNSKEASQNIGLNLSTDGKDSIQPSEILLSLRLPYDRMPAHVRAAIRSILFIADTIKNEDDENSAIEDWESVSMVVDRLFLWIFFILCTFGSLIILALAPSLYDQRDSIDDKLRIEIPPSNCSASLS